MCVALSPRKLITEIYSLIVGVLKNHPIEVSLSFFIISCIWYMLKPTQSMLVLVGAAFASIFAALKYKLDQANYHRSLFDQRYECFLTIEKCLDEWITGGLRVNQQMIELVDSVMRKSYFLFGNQTYRFITKFRLAIVRENRRRETSTDVEPSEDSRFLERLVMDENLANEFNELKIDGY